MPNIIAQLNPFVKSSNFCVMERAIHHRTTQAPVLTYVVYFWFLLRRFRLPV